MERERERERDREGERERERGSAFVEISRVVQPVTDAISFGGMDGPIRVKRFQTRRVQDA